jgi:L-lactate dehydrogenase
MGQQNKYDKLAIVGLGHVGELLADACIFSNSFKEIYTYNRDSRLVEGRTKSEAKYRNLTDASAWDGVNIIRCNSYEELPADALTVMCIKENYDYRYVPANKIREVTSRKDAPLMRKIGEAYSKKDFTGEVFVLSNPVNSMSYLFQNYSGINQSKVHPVGNMLDLARYIKFIRESLKDPAANVDAMVSGEHGSTIVFLRSSSTVNGNPLTSYGIDLDSIEKKVLQEGPITANIIGYTNAGIVASLLRLFNILPSKDYSQRFPFGMKYEDVFVELPVVKSGGLYKIVWESFNDKEKKLFEASVRKLTEDKIRVMRDAKERQQRRILIVDDEPGEADTLALSLQESILEDTKFKDKNDFSFDSANSGEIFIDMIKKDPIGYDLVIVDQRMPNMSGLDAIIEARKYQPELDCIILSGKSDMKDLQKMVNHERLTFIEKPFFNSEIYDLLKQPNYDILKKVLERTQQIII